MTKKTGLAWHIYHDRLLDYCYDYDERVAFIKENKPIEEQELRLRLFQLIPHDRLPVAGLAELDNVREAYDKAEEAYGKAGKAYDKAREDCNKAWEVYLETREAYLETREDYLETHKDKIESLHSELCPDCPFDNKTILTRKDKAGKWY